MSIRKQFAQATMVLAVFGFAAGPAVAQEAPAPDPSTQLPPGLPPTPNGGPPAAPTTPSTSCKGKKGKAKRRCKRHSQAQGDGLVARTASTGPRFLLGNTDCHTQPFAGTDTTQPLVTAADGGPSLDQQFVKVESFRYKWNGSAWAYETTIDNSWAYANDRTWSTYYYTSGRWQGRGNSGSGTTSGAYRVAQRITWIPTKSAPQEYSVFRWSPLTQDGRAVSYCSF
jgi:hypothetical protein